MLFLSLCTGISLGIFYDCFRILRIICGMDGGKKKEEKEHKKTNSPIKRMVERILSIDLSSKQNNRVPKHGKVFSVITHILVFFEDILFFLVAGCVISVLIYYTNDGIFRLMALFGVMCGFFAYYFTVGKIVIHLSDVILRSLGVFLSYCAAVLLVPCLLVVRFVIIPILKFEKIMFKRLFWHLTKIKIIRKKKGSKEKHKCPSKIKEQKKI